MPKQRNKKAVQKRFKISSRGKITHGHAYSSHNKNKKSKSRLRRQKEPALLFSGAKKLINRLLGL